MKRLLNVATNYVYALVGVTAWTNDGFSPFVLACFALAAGSAAYHQWHDDVKRRYWAHHADELGMYMVFSSLVLAMVGLHVWWLAAIAWLVLHFVALKFNAHEVLAVLASLLAGAMLQTGMYWQTLLAVGIFAGAYFLRSLDHDQYGWAHAGWHVWTGILLSVRREGRDERHPSGHSPERKHRSRRDEPHADLRSTPRSDPTS